MGVSGDLDGDVDRQPAGDCLGVEFGEPVLQIQLVEVVPTGT